MSVQLCENWAVTGDKTCLFFVVMLWKLGQWDEGEDEQPCLGTHLAPEAAAGMWAPIPGHGEEQMPLITRRWGGRRIKKKAMFFWISPLWRQRKACHKLMGHFHKSLVHAEGLSLSELMQLSACLSRKCFPERYDYSRLLSKFICVSSFKQHKWYMWKDYKEREGATFSIAWGRAGEEVMLPVQQGHL